jgi:hypothetical protein
MIGVVKISDAAGKVWKVLGKFSEIRKGHDRPPADC